ncbi:hypothetical protein [Streptomyces scabiei]|uniref:hypothetical protein n=1 Tax=Streptomyces scabiei TaxID=1930 RepID=UPI0029AB7C0C|nr:hypothetical protein [Streptomyces scabiei]MDX3142263.1 hypothetical protein [Streptomyces scabiei]
MPNQPKTPVSRFRIDAELWQAFGESVPDDTDRSEVLRRFVAYYCRRPGAKLPERPPAGPWSTPPQA